VLKLIYGSSSILLTGDASRDVEDRLLRKCGSLLINSVLKVAHHGAITSSEEKFLQLVRPPLAVISVGRFNRFNHPSPTVLSRYQNLGIEVLRTDLNGAVVLKSDGLKFEVVHWRASGLL
jgi:competence protein ComEC